MLNVFLRFSAVNLIKYIKKYDNWFKFLVTHKSNLLLIFPFLKLKMLYACMYVCTLYIVVTIFKCNIISKMIMYKTIFIHSVEKWTFLSISTEWISLRKCKHNKIQPDVISLIFYQGRTQGVSRGVGIWHPPPLRI